MITIIITTIITITMITLRAAEGDLKDVLVWSNDRVMRWTVGVGLKVGEIESASSSPSSSSTLPS